MEYVNYDCCDCAMKWKFKHSGGGMIDTKCCGVDGMVMSKGDCDDSSMIMDVYCCGEYELIMDLEFWKNGSMAYWNDCCIRNCNSMANYVGGCTMVFMVN